jgi:hypothetical protein
MRLVQWASNPRNVLVDLASRRTMENDDNHSGRDTEAFEHLMYGGVCGIPGSLLFAYRLESARMRPKVAVNGQDIGAPVRAFAQVFTRPGAPYTLLQDGTMSFRRVNDRSILAILLEPILASLRLVR